MKSMKGLEPIGIRVCTVLVTRYKTDKEYGNKSDDCVFDYKYDYSVNNDGLENDLDSMASWFIDKIMEVKKDGNE